VHADVRALDQIEEELVQLLGHRPLVSEPLGRKDAARLLLPLPALLEVAEEPPIQILIPHSGGYRPSKSPAHSPIRGQNRGDSQGKTAPPRGLQPRALGADENDVVTLSQIRTLTIVLVLTAVALGLLAIRSALHESDLQTGTDSGLVSDSWSPGASAHLRHIYRVTLPR